MFVSPLKRRVLIGGFQYRLIAGSFLYLLSIVFAFLVALFGPVVAVLGDSSVAAGERELAAHQLLALHERVWFALPVMIALCLLHATLVSHRIVGPLERFKRIFADLAEGDLTVDVRVRRHDYLREEAEMMSEMVAQWRQNLQAIRRAHLRAGATLGDLAQAIGRASEQDSAVLAGKLGTQLDDLGREVGRFNVPGEAVADSTATRDSSAQPVAVREATSARS